jgi:hypothetical protein
LAGADQINFTLPANTPTGCTVPFQVDEGGVLSKVTFIAIGPSATATSCVLAGYTTAQLQALDNGAVITAGGFNVNEAVSGGPNIPTTTSFSAQGSFFTYSGFEIAGAPVPGGSRNPTGCTVSQLPAGPGTGVAAGVGAALDAGKITLTGPAGSGLNNTQMGITGSVYTLPFESFPPGAYTLQGSGGAGVGPFTATVVVPTQLEVTNFPSVIDRSADLTFNYTGGDPGDVIEVIGEAVFYATGSSPASGAAFTCYGTVGSGSFTVPASIVGQLPAVSLGVIENATGFGSLTVIWGMAPPNSTLIVAPLASGGTTSTGYFLGANNINILVPVQ